MYLCAYVQEEHADVAARMPPPRAPPTPTPEPTSLLM